jgi:diguanylate cyclase (GGDEF)-like protein
MALLLIDVDHFKNYNDCYGHLQGDECLQAVATELKKVFSRSGDLVARYGGEEFAIILPNAGGEAMRMAEKCRAAIEKLQIRHAETTTGDFVTISVGLSSVIPTADLKSEDLIDCADKGLYIAKEHGRNRVIYHTCHARLGKFKVA